ncbi:MAG: hypothetical protein GC179_30550 [Anaerolineaceae bacterium]|nr:hypothetical protein [Anaerolineaceae bacterium]
MSIYESHYKDQPAISMESAVMRVQFLPSIGSKMASLIYKPRQLELMVQNPSKKYLIQPYDGHYVSAECSGFDEMFPTIDTCYYETYPWAGTKIPDHGEVWSLNWQHHVEDEHLFMSTYGVRFPYKLDKAVSFAAPHILQTKYTLTNLSDFDFDFMWAAHTMINLEDEVELVLPSGVEAVNSVSTDGSIGSYGDEASWPQFHTASGELRDLSKLRPQSTRAVEKYFVKGKLPEGWCGLKYHQSGFSMALSFPVETVPYLAVLPNEGGWRDIHNIFLEPATATFDRLDLARKRSEYSTVRAHSTYEWHLNISLSDGVNWNTVSQKGDLV